MIYVVNTETGSSYVIDLTNRTWQRKVEGVLKSEAPLRTTSGAFDSISEIELGCPLIMRCPPIKEGTTFRLITTSNVVSFGSFEYNDEDKTFDILVNE